MTRRNTQENSSHDGGRRKGNKTRGNYAHGDDWTAEHARLAEDQALFDSLKFDGVIIDVEGKPRELRRCPGCRSSFSGPPVTWGRVFAVLREQTQKCDASLDLIAQAFAQSGPHAALHVVPALRPEVASPTRT